MASSRESERTMADTELPERVAVVAVHGIGNQSRGDTGRAVALQLAAASGGTLTAHDRPLDVPPLDPAQPYQRWLPPGWRDRGVKAMQQSLRSDFLDQSIGAAPAAPPDAAAPPTVPRRNSAPACRVAASAGAHAAEPEADVGVRFTDYLLAKAQQARQPAAAAAAADGAAEPAVVPVHRVDGPQLHADVFEMHWADLSQLPGSAPRVVTELFTLVFNLSRLGVDTLSLADALSPGSELRAVAALQRAADWLFSRLLALLALQLPIVALVLAPALLVHAHPDATRWLLAGMATLGGASLAVYRLLWPWRSAVALGAVLGAAVWMFVGSGWGLHGTLAAWLVGVSALTVGFLDYCEQRFRAVLGTGLVLLATTFACIVGFALGGGKAGLDFWLTGTLGALEAVLLAHALLWPVLALMVAGTVVLSELALRRGLAQGRDHRQTLATARLGLLSSIGAFLVCMMIGFALLAWMLAPLAGCALYEPWWFRVPQGAMCASDFIAWRADQHAATFAPIALLLLALVGFVGLTFGPSVGCEVRLVSFRSPAALGRWLTAGYRALERLVRLWGVAVALVAVAAALALWLNQVPRLGLSGPLSEAAQVLRVPGAAISDWSTGWIDALLYAAAGSAAGVLTLGQMAVRRLKALRAPLDSALDVDNHFREFPREAISRVRIVERYVALLDHLRTQGYRRVVIVAHSQGTVITAELLRYLQQRQLLQPGATPVGQVDPAVLRDWLDDVGVRLLTVGSPLRQLYGLRFPAHYAWTMSDAPVLDGGAAATGPQPHELGVTHWSNLWCSGDYVGRWLWAPRDESRPAPLQVQPTHYDGGELRGRDAKGRPWSDTCIAADAHTHYFDLGHRRVADALFEMVRRTHGLDGGAQPERAVHPARP